MSGQIEQQKLTHEESILLKINQKSEEQIAAQKKTKVCYVEIEG